MTRYDLPESLTVAGRDYSVRWDFRAAMDIFAAMNDPDLGDQERALRFLRRTTGKPSGSASGF